MNRTLISLTVVAGLTLALPTLADDTSNDQSTKKIERTDDGSLHEKSNSSSENTDANGTYTSEQKKTKIDVDANGNGKKVVEKTSVNDPKGLFNKTKTVTTDTDKYKDGTSESEHSKTVNGTTVEKTTKMNTNQ